MAVFSGNGSATSPSFTFSSDTNLGIYREDADKLGFATAGSGQMFIDSSGNVGIGTSGPSSKLDVNGSIYTNAFFYSLLTTDRRNLILQRLDGITAGQTNGILFQQEYTTGSGNPRRIGFFGIKRDNSVSGDQRANFTMELCPDNSTNIGSGSPAANTEAFMFRYNGRLNIVKSGGGIEFQGGGTANLLDDYEEGSVAPVFTSSGVTMIAGQEEGKYTKIGTLVYYCFSANVTTAAASGPNVISVSLPFTAINTTYAHIGQGSCASLNGLPVQIQVTEGTATCTLVNAETGVNISPTSAGITSSVVKTIKGAIVFRSA